MIEFTLKVLQKEKNIPYISRLFPRHECPEPHVDAKKKPPELLQVRRLQSKTAATYSPTVTQYHRRDKA